MGTPPGEDRGPSGRRYVFASAGERAQRRLALLQRCHDAASFERAAALGVGAGWRCLDAGAGGGSFARWLCAQVGAGGRVVAADLDVGLLEQIAAPNVEAWQMDLAAAELPAAAFDFVHTRLVLMHVPARDQVLKRLCAALRPGGVLMIEEHDIFPVLATATGAYRDAWQAFLRAVRAAGVDPEWARDLPERLGSLGLTDVGAELDVPLFRGGSVFAEFWSLSWQEARERVAASGDSGELIDHGQAELADEQRWFHGPAMVITWAGGPRPGTTSEKRS